MIVFFIKLESDRFAKKDNVVHGRILVERDGTSDISDYVNSIFRYLFKFLLISTKNLPTETLGATKLERGLNLCNILTFKHF